MSTPPSSQAQQNASVATPPKMPRQVLCPTINSDPLLRSIENIDWNMLQDATGVADRFTFPFDIDLDPSGEGELPLPDYTKMIFDEPQFKVHDKAEYHPDPNKQPLVVDIVDVHPVLTGQVALYCISFTDRSMMVNIPQYDLHPLPNIVF